MAVNHSARSAIRTWALVATASIGAFLMGISAWLIALLSSKDWCNAALGAAKYALDITKTRGEGDVAVGGCLNLLNSQVDYLGWAMFISISGFGGCMLILVVIVLTGGRLSFTANRDGITANISKDRAAQKVANAAQDEADDIRGTEP